MLSLLLDLSEQSKEGQYESLIDALKEFQPYLYGWSNGALAGMEKDNTPAYIYDSICAIIHRIDMFRAKTNRDFGCLVICTNSADQGSRNISVVLATQVLTVWQLMGGKVIYLHSNIEDILGQACKYRGKVDWSDGTYIASFIKGIMDGSVLEGEYDLTVKPEIESASQNTSSQDEAKASNEESKESLPEVL